MLMDKCSRALCECVRIQIRLFSRLSDDIEICGLLYKGRFVLLLQLISTSFIFTELVVATYKAYAGLFG